MNDPRKTILQETMPGLVELIDREGNVLAQAMYQGLMHGEHRFGLEIYNISSGHTIVYDCTGMPVPLLEFMERTKVIYDLHLLRNPQPLDPSLADPRSNHDPGPMRV